MNAGGEYFLPEKTEYMKRLRSEASKGLPDAFSDEGVQEQMMIRPIDQTDRERIDAFIIQQWYTMQMVVHGRTFDLGSADGFYTCDGDEITGLITFRVNGKEMDSVLPETGI